MFRAHKHSQSVSPNARPVTRDTVAYTSKSRDTTRASSINPFYGDLNTIRTQSDKVKNLPSKKLDGVPQAYNEKTVRASLAIQQ